jgi:hypothetical protein
MTSLAATGHRELEESSAIRAAVEESLAELRVRGVWSMLAQGADSLVAEAALRLGLPIACVLPFASYDDDFRGAARQRFKRLLSQCADVVRLSGRVGDDAYLQAGKAIVDRGQLLLALWDGEPPEGSGGTADIVHYACAKCIPVLRLDPLTLSSEWID